VTVLCHCKRPPALTKSPLNRHYLAKFSRGGLWVGPPEPPLALGGSLRDPRKEHPVCTRTVQLAAWARARTHTERDATAACAMQHSRRARALSHRVNPSFFLPSLPAPSSCPRIGPRTPLGRLTTWIRSEWKTVIQRRCYTFSLLMCYFAGKSSKTNKHKSKAISRPPVTTQISNEKEAVTQRACSHPSRWPSSACQLPGLNPRVWTNTYQRRLKNGEP
jgi:hypothetical protein